ncbi:hypothetical protein GGX14DRAFT_397122 [Mycena pura]|uniref:Uncharacterized protein n=1 Tax=Mycena pura TaxID=153505 RepID=A0AAD6V9G1_9AGAR|nr:hypothetical protein GGX14DRAFT_397122 [Mycena pura]
MGTSGGRQVECWGSRQGGVRRALHAAGLSPSTVGGRTVSLDASADGGQHGQRVAGKGHQEARVLWAGHARRCERMPRGPQASNWRAKGSGRRAAGPGVARQGMPVCIGLRAAGGRRQPGRRVNLARRWCESVPCWRRRAARDGQPATGSTGTCSGHVLFLHQYCTTDRWDRKWWHMGGGVARDSAMCTPIDAQSPAHCGESPFTDKGGWRNSITTNISPPLAQNGTILCSYGAWLEDTLMVNFMQESFKRRPRQPVTFGQIYQEFV